MKLFFKVIFVDFANVLKNGYLDIYYLILLKYRNVKFNNLPKIHGKLIINNSGNCKLGDNIIFNSSLKSNLVGLYKPCTINVSRGAALIINDNCGFSGVSIYCSNKIEIGKYLNCGGNVCIWDTDFHPIDYLDRRAGDQKKTISKPIKIGDDVFIGANSIILKGIEIGDRSIIGAGSVITKSIPADEVWAGNPARFIKKIQ